MNTVSTARIVVVCDADPDPSYLEQEGWEDRLAQYRNGDFEFVGVYLEADVHVPVFDGTITMLTKERSCGLWGIESDSGEDYFRSVACDEYHEFAAMLAAMNCGLPVNLDSEIVYR